MSWQEVDKLVQKTLKNGEFTNKGNIPFEEDIQSLSYKGVPRDYPKSYRDWKIYSLSLLNHFDEIWRCEATPTWDTLNFRDEKCFKAGIFGGFSEIWMIFINCLPCDKTKFIAYKHINLNHFSPLWKYSCGSTVK